jgi:hypothetical protein
MARVPASRIDPVVASGSNAPASAYLESFASSSEVDASTTVWISETLEHLTLPPDDR